MDSRKYNLLKNKIAELEAYLNGGKGSGNFGHAGRPGQRGGSGKGGPQRYPHAGTAAGVPAGKGREGIHAAPYQSPPGRRPDPELLDAAHGHHG